MVASSAGETPSYTLMAYVTDLSSLVIINNIGSSLNVEVKSS